jgi:hypothetical protein
MKARCKFSCSSVAQTEHAHQVVKLTTHYDASLAEDERFTIATPSGTMEFILNNPALAGFFTPGKKYYIDITEA